MENQWVNITDFGAVGDGIHDDSIAYLSAVESRFTYICVPIGNWTINSSVGEIIDVIENRQRFITCLGDGCRCQRQNYLQKFFRSGR